MASPNKVWIRSETVYAIHESQISEHGGLVGVRSPEGLASALERPRQAHAYESPRPGVPALAARYAIAIVRPHPFFDGNKRVGFVLLELFLDLNGYALTATDEEALTAMWSLAAGDTSAQDFTAWVCLRSKRKRSR